MDELGPDGIDTFRAMARAFYTDRVIPEYATWQNSDPLPREFWCEAGQAGLLGPQVPQQYGGAGRTDFELNIAVTEAARHMGIEIEALRIHNDVAVPTIVRLANDEQRARWLPGLATGETVATLAMPRRPLADGLDTLTMRLVRDGARFIVYGAGLNICPGFRPDLIVTPVRTDIAAGRDGLSLLVIDAGSPRLTTRRPAATGPAVVDLVELVFDDVVVPDSNLLGELHRGFHHLVPAGTNAQRSFR